MVAKCVIAKRSVAYDEIRYWEHFVKECLGVYSDSDVIIDFVVGNCTVTHNEVNDNVGIGIYAETFFDEMLPIPNLIVGNTAFGNDALGNHIDAQDAGSPNIWLHNQFGYAPGL